MTSHRSLHQMRHSVSAENQTSIGTVTATDTDTDDSSIVFSVSGSELSITSGGVLNLCQVPQTMRQSLLTQQQ